MRRLRGAGIMCLIALAFSTMGGVMPALAANTFANPAFQAQWRVGEAIVPNFWGPLALAKDGQNEPYVEGSLDFSESGPTNPGQGMRLVQYFDKARMELTHPASGLVTNGLLANELITGMLQVGDDAFQQMTPAAIPIAGDPDNAGPTYAQLGTTAASLLAPAPSKIGTFITVIVGADGTVTDGGGFAGISLSPGISAYDSATQHNVLGVFADYRTKVGLASVGLAKSEPFRATVKIAGTQQSIIAQVFERRVLTYNNSNPEPFKVEFGNIGQHYYKWRYPTGVPLTVPTTAPTPTGATGDPGQAALQALPAGYSIKSVQAVDLGVEGQQQAIFVAENPPINGEIVGLVVMKNGAWTLAFRTKANDHAIADIKAYTKTSMHPGFVAASYHGCGANCNAGEHTIVRWDGNGVTTIALNGTDDRGGIKADPASGRVTLAGPVYRGQDPRCCPSYTFARSWVWQGGSLVPDTFDFLPIDTNTAPPLPQWLKSTGPALVSFLAPFEQNPVGASGIGALFKDQVSVLNLQGQSCMATGAAVGNALAGIIAPYVDSLWPVDTGGYRFTVILSSSGGGPAPSAQAGGCALGGAGTGGYVITILPTMGGFTLVDLQAVARPFTGIPDTAIQVPPT
jgi:hypothetical protein